MKGNLGLFVLLCDPNRLGFWVDTFVSALRFELGVVDRDLEVKLFPNLILAGDELDVAGEGESDDIELLELTTTTELGVETLPESELLDPNLRRPANSCLLDFLVVETIGLGVVVEDDGAIVVLVVDREAEFALTEFNRVWNRLLRLPNLFLVDAEAESELSVAVLVVVCGLVVLLTSLEVCSLTVEDIDIDVDVTGELEIVDEDCVMEDETLLDDTDGGLTEVVT